MSLKNNVINLQKSTEKLIKALENQNFDSARIELNKTLKSARNRLDYLRRVNRTQNLTGTERTVARQELTRAEQEFKTVRQSVEATRNTIRREELKEQLSRTGSRKLYGARRRRAEKELSQVRKAIKNEQGINTAINQLNEYSARRAAMAERERQLRSEGTTLRRFRAQEKLKALYLNMIYQNSDYDLSESKVKRLNDIFKKFLGFDLMETLDEILNKVDIDYGSGDVYEDLKEATETVEGLYNNLKKRNEKEKLLSAEEVKEIEKAIKEFYEGVIL